LKFVAVSSKGFKAQTWLRKVYVLFTDYVLKNPFYQLNMPVRVRIVLYCVVL
jgi:hypothetical protein